MIGFKCLIPTVALISWFFAPVWSSVTLSTPVEVAVHNAVSHGLLVMCRNIIVCSTCRALLYLLSDRSATA